MSRNIITIILIIIVITVISFFLSVIISVLNTGALEKPNACRLNTRGS